MGILNSLNISASGLTAQRVRMDVVSNNIANVDVTGGQNGKPFVRQLAVMRERSVGRSKGVYVRAIVRDTSPMRIVYEPGHPDANEDGYVVYPNVNIINEMMDLISATRAYEANVTTLNAAKSMALRALEIGSA